jgi:AcrR family transcriptional regulator
MRSEKNHKAPRAPGRPRSEQAKRHILNAAYKLLKTKGLKSVRSHEIATSAGVSSATLYRWWASKEEIIFDACTERVKPVLAVASNGSPLRRLRDLVLQVTNLWRSEDGKVLARLVTGIHGDKKLQGMFLERFVFPRRQIHRRIIQEAIDAGELEHTTDPELLIDALHGPIYFRWLQEHAPLDKDFLEALIEKVISAFTPK